MKRIVALLMLLIIAFVVAACGRDDADSPHSQGVTDTEILIANSAVNSGALAFVGLPFNAGIQAYLDMVNAGGGIAGRTIRFLHVDDEFNPVLGLAALQSFVEDDRVFAIVGHVGTPVVAATLADIREYGIPVVYFASGIRDLYSSNAVCNDTGRNIFPVQPIFLTEGKILTSFAAGRFGATRIGVIYANDDAGIDMYEGIRIQAANIPGLEVISQEVAVGAPDVSAAVATIRGADVDVIILATIQHTLPALAFELAAQGVGVPAITSYVNTDVSMAMALAPEVLGNFDLYSTGWLDLEVAHDDIDAYVQWVHPDFAGNAFGQAGWIAAATFVEGLRRVEARGEYFTWDNFIAAMERAPIEIPFGGSVDFTNGLREGVQEMVLNRLVPICDDFPMGWEMVAPLTNMNDLIGR